MPIKVIGLIQLLDAEAFEIYRSQVGATVEKFGGTIAFRGNHLDTFWNELGCGSFNACVELEFPSRDVAVEWAASDDYQRLLPVRNKAMAVTLFSVG